jgi:uncharacterized integral membrane protein (TIGR00697 family)
MNNYARTSDKISPLFVGLVTIFVACLLTSNIISGRLIQVGNITLTAAVIIFPITYIFGDVMTEVYGFKKARLTIWLGFFCNFLMILLFTITLAIPAPSFFGGTEAYKTVLSTTPKIFVASLLAYVVGSFANSVVMSRLKIATEGKYLWIRTIGSTIVGEACDSIIFITIVFYGTLPLNAFFTMMIAQYIWKVAYEVIITPVTYKIVGWIKKKEDLDTYDEGVKYQPFKMGVN